MSNAPPASTADTDQPSIATADARERAEERLGDGEQLVDGQIRWCPNDVY